jgi:hypothetical protein
MLFLCWSILFVSMDFIGLNGIYFTKLHIFMLWYDAEFHSQLDSSTEKCILKASNVEQLQWINGKEHQQYALSSEDGLLTSLLCSQGLTKKYEGWI